VALKDVPFVGKWFEMKVDKDGKKTGPSNAALGLAVVALGFVLYGLYKTFT
jgi:hypothetical protein